ncbi:HPP family protein [Paenibacillus albus]|uniref:HPP family protein n=1 Tax=Paenibacillus albus TaxID=2495582 RepID=A0A3S9A0F5_9BACL|nr:HPP family protein [Paenibacillus albus]AZN39208.1 HPP family protein [Paenibacillus albus]
MNVKTLVICLYVMLIYWLSLHVSFLDTLFFPTLGAFSFLFLSRPFTTRELAKVVLGAVVTSLIGLLLVSLYASAITLFINVVIAIWLIRKFKWNAPPIAAIALIPFFSHSPHLWAFPISVTAALLGLMGVLYLAGLVERKFGQRLELLAGRSKTAGERDIAS